MITPGFIILLILSTACLLQCIYLLGVFSKLCFHQPEENEPKQGNLPVSVIICGKNESENILKNLPSILNQDYKSFEVVFVNDGSWDKSLEVLEDMETRHPNLKIVNIVEQEKYPKGKKFALTLGIKAASHEHLLLTDADCQPQSPQWISNMVRNYKPGTDIVLGFSPFTKDNSLLNYFIRFETFMTGLFYLSFALIRKPYMGVGRNLSYTKDTFFKHKGFASHNHLISGDDDLFVNEATTTINTAIEVSPESFVISEPEHSFGKWLNQKKRHLSTGRHYKARDRFRLGFYYVSLALFYIAFALSFIFPEYLIYALGVFTFRLLLQHIILYPGMKLMKEKSLIYGLFFLDILYFFFMMIMGTRSLLTRNKRWLFV